jgi:hypothetical protein
MRVSTTPDFTAFLMANSIVYPYSKLMPTRNTFYCKWVMLKGVHMDLDEYFPVLANCLPNAVLLDLLMSGRGKPFPPDLSNIMDDMCCWGKYRSIEWYSDCVDFLGHALWEGKEDYKHTVRYLVSMEVRAILFKYFNSTGMTSHLLYSNWLLWFNETYNTAPKLFHKRAKYSFEYVNWSIAQVNYQQSLQLYTLSDTVRSSCVAIASVC